MPIQIGSATVTYTSEGAVTTYPDGTSYGALPHDTPHYDEIAKRCGYLKGVWRGRASESALADARRAYCLEHEAAHHMVSEWIMGRRSEVLWSLAHGYDPDPADAILEEIAAQTFQRWIRANERPIVAGVDWDDLKSRALEVLDLPALAASRGT